ncbi:glycosyltransferase [bacterium]|jgi:1,2-diacylglycerol 3-alpha-glucosyltransferase|nr:glycosyltransferase [bacterium]
MHIGIFTDTYAPQINGVVTSTISFKKAYEAMGHKVTVFCPSVPGAKESTEDVKRFRSVTYPFQKEYRLVLPFTMSLKEVKALNLDVIHAQTPFTMGYMALKYGKKLGVPVVHTYHTFFAEYIHYVPCIPVKLVKKWAHKESRDFCNRCAHVVVPSVQMKDKLGDYGVTVPMSVVPTGVSSEDVTDEEKVAFRSDFDLLETDRVLMYVGRLAHEKNILFLAQAFARLRDQFSSLKLVLIGDGPARKDLENKIDELGIKQSVIITGYVDRHQVFVGLDIAELLVFPSKTETQGLSIIEALAMGTPAVCINEMGVSDVLAQNRGGYLTEDCLDSYVEHVALLLNDSSLREIKQKEAIQRASDFSEEALAQTMISIYEGTLES